MSEALAVQNGQDFFSPEQRKMIRDSFLGGASDAEASVLLEVARVRHLNPITRQIHFLKRKQWDDESKSYQDRWSYQTSIDGLRAIAERTGRYDGQDEPEFEYGPQGQVKLARVRVYKKGISRPFVGVAHWGEYVQLKKDGHPTKMWAEKPHIMLGKCAEALALRKGYPEETSGLYTEEEMAKTAPAEEVAPAAEKPAPRKAAVQVVEVDTRALAARREPVDATLEQKLQETVAKNGAAAPRAEETEVGAPDGNTAVTQAKVAPAGSVPDAREPGQPHVVLPPGPTAFEQLLALLDEVRISGGWKSKARMREWCTDYKAHIDPLTDSEKATIRGAIEVCGYRK